MQFTGKINSIGKDFMTGKCTAAFTIDQHFAAEDMSRLYDQTIDIIVKKHRNKRSLNANSFYWVLLSKLAKVLELSNQELHNIELQRYGQLEKIDGDLVAVQLPDDEKTVREIRQKAEYHLAPTSKVVKGARGMKRVYLMIRGSSTYDTAEMSRLIKGLISDCKDAKIPDSEIMTPFERQALKEQYGIDMEYREEQENSMG